MCAGNNLCCGILLPGQYELRNTKIYGDAMPVCLTSVDRQPFTVITASKTGGALTASTVQRLRQT